jgi:outer membrane receptor protein involved in Fe transport
LSANHFDTRTPQSEALVPPESAESKFSSPRPVFETESTSGIWDLEWELAENVIFENKVIYTGFANDRLTAPSDAYANIDGSELQVEPLVRLDGMDDRLRGLMGLRYFTAGQDEFVNIYNGATFDDKTETSSAYGEITYASAPRMDVAWKAHDFHTLGAKTAGGYRAGGAGITFDVPWTSYAFDEEYVWNYELYSRHRICNDLLELTANIFYNDYK